MESGEMEGGRAGCLKLRDSRQDFSPRPALGLNCYTISEYSKTSFTKLRLMCVGKQAERVWCVCVSPL